MNIKPPRILRTERTVLWRRGQPVYEKVRQALKDYVNYAGLVQWWGAEKGFVVTLVGEPKDPADLAQIDNDDPLTRHFSVFLEVSQNRIRVVTYNADPLAIAAADGFAEVAIEMWGYDPVSDDDVTGDW